MTQYLEQRKMCTRGGCLQLSVVEKSSSTSYGAVIEKEEPRHVGDHSFFKAEIPTNWSNTMQRVAGLKGACIFYIQ